MTWEVERESIKGTRIIRDISSIKVLNYNNIKQANDDVEYKQNS